MWPARDSTPSQNQDFVDLKVCKIHYTDKNQEVSSCFSHQNDILVCFYCPTHLHLAKFALSDSSCEKPWQRCHWSIGRDIDGKGQSKFMMLHEQHGMILL